MESTLKEIRGDKPSVLDMDPKSTVGGCMEDVYGEDRATEEELVTPWTLSVARSDPISVGTIASFFFLSSCFS